jgi:hypothetical protein
MESRGSLGKSGQPPKAGPRTALIETEKSHGRATARLTLMLKYGLPTQSTIALFEAGFSDRVIASDLATLLNLNGEMRRDVIQKLRAERPSVNQVLQKYLATLRTS